MIPTETVIRNAIIEALDKHRAEMTASLLNDIVANVKLALFGDDDEGQP